MNVLRAVRGRYRLGLGCWMIWTIACCYGSSLAAESTCRLENDYLLVEIAESDGAVVRLFHKQQQLELISQLPEQRTPWAMLLGPLRLVSDFESFALTRDAQQPETVVLTWQTPYDITVVGRVTLAAEADQVEFTCAASNAGDETILGVRYPALQGIGSLSDDGLQDRLLHSTAMGLVYRNPLELFRTGTNIPFERGPAVSRYPNGYHGSALQLMSYYTEDRGGFYIATHDGRSTDKDLNFFKHDANSLSCEIAHWNWDARSGKSLELDYPVVVAALNEGSWYAAADRYLDWATQQPWCARGTRLERLAKDDSARWLTEQVGAVGMWWLFRQDIETSVKRTREAFAAPLLHLDLWWQHEASFEEARRGGDRFGPFYFPYLCLQGSKTFDDHKADAVAPPGFSISPEWRIMCAAQPQWRDVFVESGVDLVGEGPLRHTQIWIGDNQIGCDADCLYYDIGPCAGIPTHCYAPHHDHPPGAGRGMTDAQVRLVRDSQQAVTQAKGQYVPIGTECISEPFVGCMDMYYPRNAGLATEMELAAYTRHLTWLPDGQMEAVPLFAYVYHEYQGVPIQGVYGVDPWRFTAGQDYHTWAEARSIAWGGLFATHALPDDIEPSADRVRYLQSLTTARTQFAKDYLCYGRMQRPPVIECATVQIDHGLAEGGWFRELRFSGDLQKAAEALQLAEQEKQEASADSEKGKLSPERWVADVLAIGAPPATQSTLEVPSVVSSAYTFGNRQLGIFLVSIPAEPTGPVKLEIDPEHYGLPSGTYEVRLVTMDDVKPLGTLAGPRQFELTLPPREAVLLEIGQSD